MNNRQLLISELEKSFRTVFRMFRRELNDLFQDEITSTEFSYLKYIMEKDKVMTSLLSQEFHVSTSHITAVTDRLVHRELVTRKRAEDDRRVVYLCITEKGKTLVDLLEIRKHQYMQGKFKELSDEEVGMLLKLFSKIT